MQGSASKEPSTSTLKTPLADQGEWAKPDPVTPVNNTANTTVTPSRQPFPRQLSLLHNDASATPSTSAETGSLARKTSLTKPLTLGSQGGPETPRRGKRMSLQYIPSPSTSAVAADPSSSRRVSDGPKTHAASSSDVDDWLASDDDAASLHKSMAQRDSDRVESQFHDTGYREGITAGKLSTLQGGFDQGFNELRDATGSTVLGQTRDLLNRIAVRERRCFELREELKHEELQLQHLRTAWQQAANQQLAYSGGTSAHKRTTSTATSSSTDSRAPAPVESATSAPLPTGVPQSAAEAWTSFSSKLPVTLKSQLTNLFDSLANIDAPPPPDAYERKQAASRTSSDMLRPGIGSSLGVLEEEGSDVGSAALSPRSPRSPAVPLPEPKLGANSDVAQHAKLSALAKPKPKRATSSDSSVLGFLVNEHGIATPAETPPKGSVLSSLTNLSKAAPAPKVDKTAARGDENTAVRAGDGADTFATMFAKRFREARENASDLLREAEKKLGTAMTMDDLLGVTSPSSAKPDGAMSPRIQVEGREEAASPWYEAAGGKPRRSNESDAAARSPVLGATVGGGLYGLLRQTMGPPDAHDVSPNRSPKPDASPTLDWNWDSNAKNTDKEWDWDASAAEGAKAGTQRHRLRAAALRTPRA